MRSRASACVTLIVAIAAPTPAQPACATWQECREQALIARDRGDGEAFHDFAWRTVQTGPRNDATLMLLLARAQSMSGRPDDALVMLHRLLDRGIDLTDAETSDDFRRVRTLPGWLDLAARLHGASIANSAPLIPSKSLARRPAPLASTSTPRLGGATATPPLTPTRPSDPTKTPLETGRVLTLPSSIRAPLALSYDAVSGRLLMADGETETIKVLSELSGNATNLVSRGWGGPYRTTAMAIDATRGDLWIVATATDTAAVPAAVLHRLQLISGRLLYSVPADTDRGAVAFSSLAVAGSRILVLDTAGSRLLELTDGKTLRERVKLSTKGTTSVAAAEPDIAYVAHERGLLRIVLTDGRSTPVTAAEDGTVDELQWIGHHRRSILGVQRQPDGTYLAVRLRLAPRGRRVTAREVLGPAASPAAAIMRNEFFYVALQPDGSTAVQRVALR